MHAWAYTHAQTHTSPSNQKNTLAHSPDGKPEPKPRLGGKAYF